MARQGVLAGTVGLVAKAAEDGHLAVVRWLIENESLVLPYDLANVTLDEPENVDEGEGLPDFKAEATLSIHLAVINGHLAIAKYLREQAPAPARNEQRVVDELASLRRPKWMWRSVDSRPMRVSSKTMEKAVKNGDIDVVKWLYDEYQSEIDLCCCNIADDATDASAMDVAAKYGHLEVLQYLHELQVCINCAAKTQRRQDNKRPKPECTLAAMDCAAGNGHLEVVQWLQQNRSEGCTTRAMDAAATGGHLNVVRWLGKYRSEGCTVAAMDGAIRNGHLEVVKWLHRHGSEGCSTRAMDKAAMNGHVDVVKWLHQNRIEGCTTAAMDGAAAQGFLNVVRWLHYNRSEGCTQQAMDKAANNGHLQVVQWLDANRPEGCSSAAIDGAARNNHWEVFLFLHSHCHVKCTALAAISTSDNLRHWIVERYPAFQELDL
jgi:ankyrin repeat protein